MPLNALRGVKLDMSDFPRLEVGTINKKLYSQINELRYGVRTVTYYCINQSMPNLFSNK